MRDVLPDGVAPAPAAPYLSIILTGRNDNFGGDFNERFLQALLFNHQRLTAARVPHEFVVVEWAPLPDRPYLATVVEEACGGLLASGQLVSYVVDPRYHQAFSLNDRIAFQEFIAKNVGVRRCSGQFILTTNTDIYLGRGVVRHLATRALERETLYRTVRVDLRKELVLAAIDWDVLENVSNVEVFNRIRPPWYTNASGDFLLLDRQTYHQLGAFNEIYRVAKIHLDANFCVKAHASGVRFVDMGAPVYHVGQGTLYANNPRYKDRPELAPWGNIRWNSEVIYDNPPGWGLARAPQRELGTGITYLDFDWDVVPPLVDLRRVGPAASRSAAPSA
jgi:hypothetical protein